MEPIPYYFESINRNAFILKPKQPYFDWANQVFGEEPKLSERDENNIYLIHEKDHNAEVRKWIKNNFECIFNNELNDWCTDEEAWPQGRNYNMFEKWFSIEVHSMIIDLEDEDIEKD